MGHTAAESELYMLRYTIVALFVAVFVAVYATTRGRSCRLIGPYPDDERRCSRNDRKEKRMSTDQVIEQPRTSTLFSEELQATTTTSSLDIPSGYHRAIRFGAN